MPDSWDTSEAMKWPASIIGHWFMDTYEPAYLSEAQTLFRKGNRYRVVEVECYVRHEETEAVFFLLALSTSDKKQKVSYRYLFVVNCEDGYHHCDWYPTVITDKQMSKNCVKYCKDRMKFFTNCIKKHYS